MTDAEFRLGRAAEGDPEGRSRHGAERGGRNQAGACARRLNDSLVRLAALPDLGPAIHSRLGILRMPPVGSLVVIYRPEKKGILILRVLAARQDRLALLGGEG